MENFSLWSISHQEGQNILSFFASPVHIQRIYRGTAEMTAEMLKDLGAQSFRIHEWWVRHLVTDYLADDPLNDDWQNRYRDTWEITIKTTEPVSLNIKPPQIASTWAIDASWAANDTPINEFEPVLLPAELVVVSDFYTRGQIHNAQERLGEYGKIHIRPGIPNQLIVTLGDYNKVNFSKGVNLARQVQQTVRLLGGTTTWREMVR
jgi:hypothetical protein